MARSDGLSKDILFGKVPGRRKRGRPKTSRKYERVCRHINGQTMWHGAEQRQLADFCEEQCHGWSVMTIPLKRER